MSEPYRNCDQIGDDLKFLGEHMALMRRDA